MTQRRAHRSHRRDDGTVMPLVLIITIVLSVVVMAMANYSTTNLKYGRVAEDRSDRLAAADAGMRYALDQIKLKARGCVWDDAKHNLPGIASDFNGATAQVSCQRITTGLDDIKLYAAVMTGEGTASGDNFLLSSQGGSTAKVLGGPVYMQRVDASAFYFDSSSTHAGVEIEDGPLLYHDPTPQCTPEKPSVVIARAQGKLTFTPDLIFGPECVNQSWQQKFPSPPIPTNLKTGLPVRSGTTQISLDLVNPYTAPYNDPSVTTTLLQTLRAISLAPSPSGGFVDFSGGGGCRVFFPGRYTTSPATSSRNAYFLSGDYVFDLPNSNAKLVARQGVVTAGVPNPKVFRPSEVVGNERVNTTACNHIQSLDPANADPENMGGATFYFANNSFIEVETNGALEIHGRKQGDNFVSVQTLCRVVSSNPWCRSDGNGGFAPSDLKWSTLNATSTEEILYTDSGNGKEFVAHGLFYAPLAEAEFGNVSNSAIQKMRGGIVVSQLILQAATSATNFEIAVPTSPITGKVEVTSTALKDGVATAIRAIIEYRPYEVNVDDRIAVNSWRVCEGGTC